MLLEHIGWRTASSRVGGTESGRHGGCGWRTPHAVCNICTAISGRAVVPGREGAVPVCLCVAVDGGSCVCVYCDVSWVSVRAEVGLPLPLCFSLPCSLPLCPAPTRE